MYHPEMGIWTIRDPAQEGLNLYEYASGNPVGATDPLGLQSRLTYKFGASADALKLRQGAWLAREAEGWTFGPDLLEHGLNGGGPIVWDSTSSLATALGASSEIRNAVDSDIENQLPEAAGALDYNTPKPVVISGEARGVTFTGGELEASVRQPDSITYRAALRITRTCQEGDNAADVYTYEGRALCLLRDEYDFHRPTSPAYANKTWYKKWALEYAYSAQQGGFLQKFTIDVTFWIKDLKGEVRVE